MRVFVKFIFLIFIYFLKIPNSTSQPPSILFQKSIGGSGNDHAHSTIKTLDGGFILTGWSESNDGNVTNNHGITDVWVVKLDSASNIEWQKCYGGTYADYSYSIKQTTDGGYVIAGSSSSNDGDVTGNHYDFSPTYDFWIIKINSTGQLLWQKCFGGTDDDEAYDIQETFDGGFIVGGYTNSNDSDVSGNHGGWDAWIIKISSSGMLQWQKCFGGGNGPDEWCTSLRQTEDSGLVLSCLVGSTDGNITCGAFDFWIAKLNKFGGLVWQRCFGGSSSEEANSVIITADGGYAVAGTTFSNDGDVTGNHGNADYWLMKFDTGGVIQWAKCYGGSLGEGALSLQQSSDGGFILNGDAGSYDGDVTGNHLGGDYWVVKTDSIGILEWQKCLGGNGIEFATSVEEIGNDEFIVGGYSDSNDGDVTGNHGNQDYWIVKLGPSGNGVLENQTITDCRVYFNPSTSELQLRFYSIYCQRFQVDLIDISGRKLSTSFLNAESGLNNQILHLEKISLGLYFIQLRNKSEVITRKFSKSGL